jgi:hypothetical protein
LTLNDSPTSFGTTADAASTSWIISKTPFQLSAFASEYPVTTIAPETVLVTLGAFWIYELSKGAVLETAFTGVVGLTPEKSSIAPADPVEPELNVQV